MLILTWLRRYQKWKRRPVVMSFTVLNGRTDVKSTLEFDQMSPTTWIVITFLFVLLFVLFTLLSFLNLKTSYLSIDIAITTNCQYPAVSAHTLTLTIVGNSESLAFTVSWPFLVDGIESTIEMETKKKRNSKWLHLVMKKSLNDAWPAGFGGRSKWDTDLLIKPWRDFPSNGTLKMHIEAQFDCFQILHRIARYSIKSVEWCEPSSTATATTQSRLISLPFTTTANWMCMSSISASIQADRFTPQGSPLLLVSVINHRLARQFIEQGKLDSEENQFEFHRIITERVSREVRIIRTSSEKEMDLFIDVLCVNSTKMRRGTWQSKNLLRCEYSPRMPIFVSPLYIEHICKECSLAHSD